jgi:outer membrane protein OmpA-like peptidoglycan-associated protein
MKKLIVIFALCLVPYALQAAGNHRTIADVYFRFGKAEITPVAKAVLETIKERAKVPQCTKLRIVGHACELGEEEFNNSLGLERAEAVRDELVRQGFDFDRISVETVGESDPIVEGTDEQRHHIRNRVVEIYLLPRESWWKRFDCEREL